MAQGRATGLSLSKQIDNVVKQLDDVKIVFVKKMAERIVDYSPVYSGKYVNGHNIGVGVRNVEGQFTGSYETSLPSQNPAAEKEMALAKLFSQADAIPTGADNFSINNTVPHAWKVEYAGWKNTNAYAVYNRARAEAGNLLQEAIQEVKAKG